MQVLTLLVIALAAAVDPVGAAPDTSKMNILFINIEDCNADARLLRQSDLQDPEPRPLRRTAVRFDSAYVQADLLQSLADFVPHRPASAHARRVSNNGHVMNEHLPAGTLTLPEMLKARVSIWPSSASCSTRSSTPSGNWPPSTGSRCTAAAGLERARVRS